MTLYKNKYRSESHRKPNWSYANAGIYFITVIVQHRKCLLGKIENGEMIPSAFGKIAIDEWFKSFDMRAELSLDAWVLMPNHFHALITLNLVNTHGRAYQSNENDNPVSTHGRAYPPHDDNNNNQENPQKRKMPERKPKSISSFVAGYKSAVITKIDDFIDELQLPIEKYNRFNKLWLNNYHDHIVRNEKDYMKIYNYIINNPKNWETDCFFP